MSKPEAFYNALTETQEGRYIQQYLDTWQQPDRDKIIEAIFKAVSKAEGRN